MSTENTRRAYLQMQGKANEATSKDQKWRVVRADARNRSGEAPGYDETWASDPSDYATALTYAKDLNDGDLSEQYYYRVVQEDYKLAVFQP